MYHYFINSVYHLSIHLSASSMYQFILIFNVFQTELEISVHFSLNTLIFIPLAKIQNLLIVFLDKAYRQRNE